MFFKLSTLNFYHLMKFEKKKSCGICLSLDLNVNKFDVKNAQFCIRRFLRLMGKFRFMQYRTNNGC